jgi:hypothetical protein
VGAECGIEQVMVHFWRNKWPETCFWEDYEAIGAEAMAAVVKAQWPCQKLQKLAHIFQEKGISREYAINSMAELASESEERKKCAFLRLNEVGSKFD